MIDNHVYWNIDPQMDPRRVTWRRVVDMNDRALRSIGNSLEELQMVTQERTALIILASEVMAILCLSKNFENLKSWKDCCGLFKRS